MANRDHSLDDGIIQAAYSEFLAYGFQKASLHKIAEKAGVTTGAIYTRYKNKDALFASLLQDFFETMQVLFAPIAEEYEKAKCSAQPDGILRAINAEEQVYFQLLTEHCNDCTLFFCRSGSKSGTIGGILFAYLWESAKCRCDPSFDGLTVLVLPPAAGSAYGGRQNAYLLTGSP